MLGESSSTSASLHTIRRRDGCYDDCRMVEAAASGG